MAIELTEGQNSAMKKLVRFIGSDDPIFRLRGSAGTGKTYLTQMLNQHITNGRMMGCGPTHKSVGVLASRLGDDVDTMTIHRFLGLKPHKRAGEEILLRKKDYDPSQWHDVTLVTLDEASMVDKQLMAYIEQDIRDWDRQYVLVGDHYQLPPTNEGESPAFTMSLSDSCDAELTQIVRQAEGNPIIACATAIRDAIISGKEPRLVGGVNGNLGAHLLRERSWLATLGAYVDHPDYRKYPDWCRVVAYKNNTVLKHTQYIRGRLGEDIALPFTPGDVVTANDAMVVFDEILWNTGQEFTVQGLEAMSHPEYPELEGWQVFLKGFREDIPVYVLDLLKCGYAYKRIQDDLRQAALVNGDWRPFYRLGEYYADLRPSFGITAHKSQGSTFKNGFLDMPDIYTNRRKGEADRALYVGVTRFSHNAYILT